MEVSNKTRRPQITSFRDRFAQGDLFRDASRRSHRSRNWGYFATLSIDGCSAVRCWLIISAGERGCRLNFRSNGSGTIKGVLSRGGRPEPSSGVPLGILMCFPSSGRSGARRIISARPPALSFTADTIGRTTPVIAEIKCDWKNFIPAISPYEVSRYLALCIRSECRERAIRGLSFFPSVPCNPRFHKKKDKSRIPLAALLNYRTLVPRMLRSSGRSDPEDFGSCVLEFPSRGGESTALNI